MKNIETLARRLKIKIASHSEIHRRLAGIVWFSTGDSARAQEMAHKFLVDVDQLSLLARCCLALAPRGKSANFGFGPNADVPELLFISSLMNFWRFDLKLPIKIWIDENSHQDSASGLVGFVHACFAVAGSRLTLEAARQRVARVRRVMDQNEAMGLDWNVLKVGSPEINFNSP